MLGDIAPILSLLHTARLQQQTPIRQNLANYLLQSLTQLIPESPNCMKKTNIQGVSILLMATHFFHFRNFFIYFLYIYSPLFISTYPSLLLCPLRETSTSSPQFCFLSPNFKSGLRNGWGFSVLEACFTKFKNYFLKRKKKETFFPTKKCQYKNFPTKL